MHKTPIIFDTDPGIDDAAAISILLTNPAFDVKLMTSVAGNVTVDKTTTNILKLAHFLIVKILRLLEVLKSHSLKNLKMRAIFMVNPVCQAMISVKYRQLFLIYQQ